MEFKSIKCPECGAPYNGDTNNEFFECSHCNAKYKIIDNDKLVRVEESKEETPIVDASNFELEDGEAANIKDYSTKRKILAFATACMVAIGAGGYVASNYLTKNVNNVTVNQRTNINNYELTPEEQEVVDRMIEQMNLEDVQAVADKITNDYHNGDITPAEATYILEKAGIMVEPYYFETIDSMRNDNYIDYHVNSR